MSLLQRLIRLLQRVRMVPALLLHIRLVGLVYVHHDNDLLVVQPWPIPTHNLLFCAGPQRRWRWLRRWWRVVFCCLLLLLCSLCWVGWRHNQRTCPQCHLLCRLRCRLRILLLASITSTIYPFLCHKNHRYSAIRRVLTTLYLDLMRKRRWCWGGQQR